MAVDRGIDALLEGSNLDQRNRGDVWGDVHKFPYFDAVCA